MKTMKNNSSPGIDGITAAWYKMFWCKIKHLVHESLTTSFQIGSLSPSQRKGIIIIIYKGKGHRNKLTNWRPITVDYKLLTKVIANRLNDIIKYIIHDDQNGYIKGRSASMIIRALDDIIEYTDKFNIPGAILTLDYTKAYDSLSKQFMITCFKKYGFGPNFERWISVINANTQSCISYCGWLSDWFPIERGIRQGCPLSPLCFILACEFLACKIRQTNKIKGIALPCNTGVKEIKILQYADDSTILINDEQSITETFVIIDLFSVFSGLVLNRQKTEAIWIGCWKYRRKQLHNIKWKIFPDNEIKVLGIFVKGDQMIHSNPHNWEAKFVKCENLIKSWRYRNLTIMGRITIAKTFLAAQFIYLMQSTILSDNILKRINTLLFKFIWNSKDIYKEEDLKRVTEKVKRNNVILIQNFKHQGLNMIDMISMQDAFSAKWVQRLSDNSHGSWKLIPSYFLNKILKRLTIFKCNIPYKQMRGCDIYQPYFCKMVLQKWADSPFYNDEHNVSNSTQVIWNNNLMKYRNTVLHIRRWINHDIILISDIVDEVGHISYSKVTEKLRDSAIARFEYNIVYNAFNNLPNNKIYLPKNEDLYIKNKLLSKWSSKGIRTILQNHKHESRLNLQINHHNYSHEAHVWNLVPFVTKESTLIAMQWKILHKIYPSKVYLNKVRLSDNDRCEACGLIDTLEHYFYECNSVQILWNLIKQEISLLYDKNILFTTETVLLGMYERPSSIDNKHFLKAKYIDYVG